MLLLAMPTNIRVIESTPENLRKRPSMYVGSTGERGVDHLVEEVVANAVDQYLRGEASRVAIRIDGGSVIVSDDGAGLPYDQVDGDGVSRAERYLTTYHASKTADDHVPHAHLGNHGLGLFVVNTLERPSRRFVPSRSPVDAGLCRRNRDVTSASHHHQGLPRDDDHIHAGSHDFLGCPEPAAVPSVAVATIACRSVSIGLPAAVAASDTKPPW